MISAKEKAKELVGYFYEILPQWVNRDDAKKCAFKTVNELIKETGSKYYYDVKKELEKL
jgi:hypothetical protein